MEAGSHDHGSLSERCAAQPARCEGHGESAAVGSTPAVQNAVVDALAHPGVAARRPAAADVDIGRAHPQEVKGGSSL